MEPGEDPSEVAQVGLEQCLPWKHGFAELKEEKSLKDFVSIKTLKRMENDLLGNYTPY